MHITRSGKSRSSSALYLEFASRAHCRLEGRESRAGLPEASHDAEAIR